MWAEGATYGGLGASRETTARAAPIATATANGPIRFIAIISTAAIDNTSERGIHSTP